MLNKTQFIYPLWIILLVPCCHSMQCPEVVFGGGAQQIWRIVADVVNWQSQTVKSG